MGERGALAGPGGPRQRLWIRDRLRGQPPGSSPWRPPRAWTGVPANGPGSCARRRWWSRGDQLPGQAFRLGQVGGLEVGQGQQLEGFLGLAGFRLVLQHDVQFDDGLAEPAFVDVASCGEQALVAHGVPPSSGIAPNNTPVTVVVPRTTHPFGACFRACKDERHGSSRRRSSCPGPSTRWWGFNGRGPHRASTERIRKRDPELNAFSQLNPGALTCARELDATPARNGSAAAVRGAGCR